MSYQQFNKERKKVTKKERNYYYYYKLYEILFDKLIYQHINPFPKDSSKNTFGYLLL